MTNPLTNAGAGWLDPEGEARVEVLAHRLVLAMIVGEWGYHAEEFGDPSIQWHGTKCEIASLDEVDGVLEILAHMVSKSLINKMGGYENAAHHVKKEIAELDPTVDVVIR